MNLIRIWDLNNEEIDLTEYGLLGLKLTIPSPSYEVTRETIDGRPGAIPLGRKLSPRELTAEFFVTAEDYDGSLLLRDEIYELFSKGNQFYIGEVKQPDKRWFVECSESWTPERINSYTLQISVPLTAEKGMAESVKNTLDPTLFSAQLTGPGSREIKYKHTETSFEIFNDGQPINPRYHDLVVTYKGASTNLTIKNLTTDEEWSFTGTSNSSDSIVLEGVRSTKNGLSIFRDTNKKLITLSSGWNEFQLIGTSGSFEVTFDFKFYTL